MVIWLFAGGGESELGNREAKIKGIVNFFDNHFPIPNFSFKRITPVRDKHREQNRKTSPINALGKTGVAFAQQIKSKLEEKVKYGELCDVILIIDDLDCCCQTDRKILFDNAINQAANGKFKDIKRIIGFASPELEAWIIADWDNTIAKHIDFRKNQKAMQHWLVNQGVSFDAPEAFSFYDESKNACHDKLSELLIESSRQKNQTIYSKATHTPFLLYDSLTPDNVAKKCPIFREFFTQLKNLEQR